MLPTVILLRTGMITLIIDLTSTLRRLNVTAGVRNWVVVVEILPVRVANVEVEGPAAKVLPLQVVPVVPELLLLHVLVQDVRHVDGQEVLLENDASQLHAAVSRHSINNTWIENLFTFNSWNVPNPDDLTPCTLHRVLTSQIFLKYQKCRWREGTPRWSCRC